MLKSCFDILTKIYSEGTYSGIALNSGLEAGCKESGAVTQIVYGVLENDSLLDYYICNLCKTKPKPAIVIVLKIGLYQLLFMSTAQYAAVNNTVELTKQIGKPALAGFVNATLKNYKSVVLPDKEDKLRYYTVCRNWQEWLVKLIKKGYPEIWENILDFKKNETRTHIRHNSRLVDKTDFEKLLEKNSCSASTTGYYVTHNTLDKLKNRLYTVQSEGSILISQLVAGFGGKQILDACAAPGGKSVCISECLLDSEITACDIHAHRVELIKKYTSRMDAENVTAVLSDSTAFKEEFRQKFDTVLCDVPCTGTGVIADKPDILLNRDFESLKNLTEIQFAILSNCAKYVKDSGYLIYSTCSILKEENDQIIGRFLSSNTGWTIQDFEFGEVESLKVKYGRQLLPFFSGTDGFYAAILRKTTE